MAEPNPTTVGIACSVFRPRIESLRRSGAFDIPVRFFDSKLHMDPVELNARLVAAVEVERKRGHRVVLVYGECSARMIELEQKSDVARTRGMNCCEIMLGSEEYRKRRREGAFFVPPEWADRARGFFETELGFSREDSAVFMQEMHEKLLYLDTGLGDIPESKLQELSEYFGLSYECVRVPPDHLLSRISAALARLDEGKN